MLFSVHVLPFQNGNLWVLAISKVSYPGVNITSIQQLLDTLDLNDPKQLSNNMVFPFFKSSPVKDVKEPEESLKDQKKEVKEELAMRNFWVFKKKGEGDKPKWSLKKQGVWQEQMRKREGMVWGSQTIFRVWNERAILELRWVWIWSLTKFLWLKSLGGSLWVAHT